MHLRALRIFAWPELSRKVFRNLFFIVFLALPAVVFAEKIKIDMPPIDVPDLRPRSIIIEGILDFENGWPEREFGVDYAQKFSVRVLIGPTKIAELRLVRIDAKSAKWQLKVGLTQLRDLSLDTIRALEEGRIKVVLRDHEKESLVYEKN